MADLAEELDISEQAVSERIRRGLNKVLNQLRIDAGSMFD
jgi:predicted DNA binding protein